MSAALSLDKLAWFQRSREASDALEALERLWNEVDRNVPAKATGEARFVFELAQMVFENGGRVPVACSDPDALLAAYQALENRWLVDAQGGRSSLISALRHQVLHSAGREAACDEPLPRETRLTSRGIAFLDLGLRVELPPISMDAHRGVAGVYREDPRQLIAEIPVPEITGYKAAGHSIEALGRLHRFSHRGRGAQTFGDSFTADGFGRELAAAMVAGLVIRTGGYEPSGMGGVSPVYALTPAGQAWVIQQPRLASLFDHFNRIEEQTAFMCGSHGTVPFDSTTGAVLALYGDADVAPLYVDVANCASPIQAGETYDVLSLAYHAVGGWYEMPSQEQQFAAP